MQLRRDSRFAAVPIYVYQSDASAQAFFTGLPGRLAMQDGDEYVVHTVDDGDTLPGIATRYYQNPMLWWTVAEVNDVAWAWDLQANHTVLKIPTKQTLARLLA